MIAQLDLNYIRTRPLKAISRLVSYAFFEGRPLTTRGRWINPLVFTFYGFVKKLPGHYKVRSPIFFIGMGRSGSTVLGTVLSMHRDVGFLNEPKAFWHVIHPEEDVIGNYSRGTGRYRLNVEEATEIRREWAHEIYSFYLKLTCSTRVVDKNMELIFRIPFVQQLFPDAKFIFLFRNGQSVCNSIKDWSAHFGKKMHGHTHDWWGIDRRKWDLLVDQIVPEHADLAPNQKEIKAFTDHADMAAVEWVVTMREGLSLLERFPQQVIPVRFEDLTRDPPAVLRRLTGFLELSDDPVFLDYAQKVLRPSQPAACSIKLNPLIRAPFSETMKKLGYE